jgi:hypothetical protein
MLFYYNQNPLAAVEPVVNNHTGDKKLAENTHIHTHTHTTHTHTHTHTHTNKTSL